MENKKLIASIATLALAANLALAGLAIAAETSDDTMTVNMNPGSLELTTPGSLTLGDANNGCSGAIDASVDNQSVCSIPGTIQMGDLRSSADNVAVSIDFGDFTGSSYSQTISAADYASIDTDQDASTPALTFSGVVGEGDFASVGNHDYDKNGTALTPGLTQTLYSFDKNNEYVIFKAEDTFQISLVVPGGKAADTYTNTIAFTIQ